MDPFDENQDPSADLQARFAAYERRRLILAKFDARAKLEEMAPAVGMHFSSLQRMMSGNRKRVGADEEAKIVNFLAQLEAENEDRIPRHLRVAANDGPRYDAGSSGQVSGLRAALRLPVFGLSATGSRVRMDHDAIIDRVRMDEVLAPQEASGAERFLLEVVDASMEPRYFPGERVIVTRNRPPRPGDDCIIEFKDGTTELRVYRGRRDGFLWFDQYNHDSDIYPDGGIKYAPSDAPALHAVIGSIR